MKKIFFILLGTIVIFQGCKKEEIIIASSNDYLNFTAVDGGATICLDSIGNPAEIEMQYTYDCKKWKNYQIGSTIKLSNGSKVYFKAKSKNEYFSNKDTFAIKETAYIVLPNCYNFIISGKVSADGNIMSLLDAKMEQLSVPDNAFGHLFENCNGLIKAPLLPATKLGYCCYGYLFSGCESLTNAPVLPATTLEVGCYGYMFFKCKSLITAPELPAYTLKNSCYMGMFCGCESLIEAPTLPAIKLDEACYEAMFCDCKNLTMIPDLPATSLANYCYTIMFNNCSSLKINKDAPGKEWSIPTDAVGEYMAWNQWMFDGTGGTFTGDPEIGVTYYIAK